MCSIAGWCSSTAAWAYAPGTGSNWTDAWSLVGPCDTGPTLTPSRTPTPCTTCGGSLPYHVITGYWQNFNNGATVLRLSSVPTSYNLIAVAFADATGAPGAVTFNIDSGLSTALGGYTNANFTSDVATIHSRGQKVIISVGGQNGTISVSDSTSANNFANSIIGLMNNFGFDGVDIDLENGINATYMAQALRSIKASFPGLIITFAPQTIDFQSSGAGYYQLAVSIKDILTINNMQYYNSGSMNGCNSTGPYSQGGVDFITAQACIQLQAGLRPDQVGLGLPASPSGAGSGYVSPSIVNNALDCLASGTNCGAFHPTTNSPGIRGAMTWSINWDASNGYAWVNAIAAHLSSVP
jgi:chitinase